MCLLFETIRICNGAPENLHYHQARLNKAMQYFFEGAQPINLLQLIQIPSACRQGIFKCRVTYGRQVIAVDFEAYTPKLITTLKLVDDNSISYPYKFADRSQLNALREKRGNCDDILIVKNGLITDTSYSNIVFYDGLRWITPAKPLLQGTMRSHLLHQDLISEADIKASDLHRYHKARLINAMLPLDTGNDIETINIVY
ncbi:MAG TPA: aminotransferase class IV family protein [Bacteroidales bacterium]|nr:aminotransferase class IV family protein [Bacteroidales bacterium]